MANAPYARDMKPARYEDYYKAPWATSREFEERHKRICSEVGASLKGFHLTKKLNIKMSEVHSISPGVSGILNIL